MAVIKVAKTGGAVTDEEKDLAFTSDRDCLIEFARGTSSITTSGSGSVNITNTLGYLCNYFVFVRDPDNTSRWFPMNCDFSLNPDVIFGDAKIINTYLTTSNLVVTVNHSYETSKTFNLFYIIHSNTPDNLTGTGKDNVSGKVRVAKPGYDASTETDARNMQFYSGKNVPQPIIEDSDSLTIGARPDPLDEYVFTLATKTITHNLGYVPVAYVFDTDGAMFPAQRVEARGADNLILNYYVTSTQLVIAVMNPASFSQTCNFKYKIMKDKIN